MTRRLLNTAALVIGGALAVERFLLVPGQPRNESRGEMQANGEREGAKEDGEFQTERAVRSATAESPT